MLDRELLRQRARRLVARETEAFAAAHPNSRALSEVARRNYLGGVPLHWMLDWATPFPLSIVSAQGAVITDADSLSYVDFCLGDSGALFGHSPPAVARALAEQGARGLTAMLPGPDMAAVGQRLARLFGLPFWQLTATASDPMLTRWHQPLQKKSPTGTSTDGVSSLSQYMRRIVRRQRSGNSVSQIC